MNRRSHSAGVSILELAIAFPIVVFITLLCIDFARYYFTLHTLNAAAHHAADTLSKSDIEVATDIAACNTNPTGCRAYFQLIGSVLNEAVRLASVAAGPSNSNSATRLVPFRQYYYEAQKLSNSATPYSYTYPSGATDSAPRLDVDAGF